MGVKNTEYILKIYFNTFINIHEDEISKLCEGEATYYDIGLTCRASICWRTGARIGRELTLRWKLGEGYS